MNWKNATKNDVTEFLKNNHINLKDADRRTSLINACCHKSSSEVIQFLIDSGADVNVLTDNGMTSLMYASRNRNPEVVQLLIDNGADVNAKDDDRWTPLMFASGYNSSPEVIQILIDNGAK